jgi:hypothetical protein
VGIAIEVVDERNPIDVVGHHRDLKAGPWKPWLQHSGLAGDDAGEYSTCSPKP